MDLRACAYTMSKLPGPCARHSHSRSHSHSHGQGQPCSFQPRVFLISPTATTAFSPRHTSSHPYPYPYPAQPTTRHCISAFNMAGQSPPLKRPFVAQTTTVLFLPHSPHLHTRHSSFESSHLQRVLPLSDPRSRSLNQTILELPRTVSSRYRASNHHAVRRCFRPCGSSFDTALP